MEVRDLVEHLQAWDPREKLRFIVRDLGGKECLADELCEVRRGEGGAVDVVLDGALVRQIEVEKE